MISNTRSSPRLSVIFTKKAHCPSYDTLAYVPRDPNPGRLVMDRAESYKSGELLRGSYRACQRLGGRRPGGRLAGLRRAFGALTRPFTPVRAALLRRLQGCP
jgi:hypothetical protein